MAGSWVKLSGKSQYGSAPLYAIDLDDVTLVQFGNFGVDKVLLTLKARGDSGRPHTVQLSAADAEIIKTWIDAHSDPATVREMGWS